MFQPFLYFWVIIRALFFCLWKISYLLQCYIYQVPINTFIWLKYFFYLHIWLGTYSTYMARYLFYICVQTHEILVCGYGAPIVISFTSCVCTQEVKEMTIGAPYPHTRISYRHYADNHKTNRPKDYILILCKKP
jgi:hypothetical protein